MEKRVAISPTQAKIFLNLQNQLQLVQVQLNAFVSGVLAGHGIEEAIGVRLENDELVYFNPQAKDD